MSESSREGFIVWYPSCNGCSKEICTQSKSYQQEVHDARDCEEFTPDEEQGVFCVENRKKEKVYLKTVNDEVVYVSKVGSNTPLYSFRLRDWYKVSTKKTLKKITSSQETVANRVLAEVSMYVQGLRLKHTGSNEDSIDAWLFTPSLTKEEIAKYKPKAEEWLKDPELLLRIKHTLDKRIVGETKNKLIVCLSANTRLLMNKLNIIPTGPSAVGKNWMLTNVLRCYPNVLDFTRITQTAPDYLTDIDLSDYILYIRQMKGIETANYSLRVLMSEGGLKLLSVIKDPKTGKMKKTVVRVKGTPVVQSTLAFGYIQDEMFTRVIDLAPDKSALQSREIVRHQGDDFATLFKEPFTEEEMIFRCINQILTPIRVVVPYAPKLAEIFPVDKVRVRRDFPKLNSVIMSIASYYREQRFRLTIKSSNETVVLANLDDLRFAIAIVWDILAKTMTDVEKPLINFYNKLKRNLGNASFTKHDAVKVTGLSENTCRNYLWRLWNKGFLDSEKMEGTKKAYNYSFSYGKIIVHELKEEITDKLYSPEDFKKFLKEKCNINPSEKELQDYYQRWQGSRSFKVEELFDSEIDINIV